MAPAVNVDVSQHAVAAVAGEPVLTVALFGRRLVPLHRQVVVGHPQLSVSRLWVQPKRLTFWKKKKKVCSFQECSKRPMHGRVQEHDSTYC